MKIFVVAACLALAACQKPTVKQQLDVSTTNVRFVAKAGSCNIFEIHDGLRAVYVASGDTSQHACALTR